MLNLTATLTRTLTILWTKSQINTLCLLFVIENIDIWALGRFTNSMHTILTKVVHDNLKACLRFVWREKQLMYAKWISSIEIPLLGTG